MEVIETGILDLYVLKPKVFGDTRGWFMETWSDKAMKEAGLDYHFVQDNHSFSSQRGTLRGLHFQKGEASQAKLVRCSRGAVLDVAVDMREGSPTYKKWFSIELSDENKLQLLVPRGFLHGFMTLTENVEFIYRVDNGYNQAAERNVIWDDPELGIDWGIENPILSDKDQIAPLLKDSDIDFKFRS